VTGTVALFGFTFYELNRLFQKNFGDSGMVDDVHVRGAGEVRISIFYLFIYPPGPGWMIRIDDGMP
jgi:hypothetical protein